jgi:hypothetical protein
LPCHHAARCLLFDVSKGRTPPRHEVPHIMLTRSSGISRRVRIFADTYDISRPGCKTPSCYAGRFWWAWSGRSNTTPR